MIMLPQHSQQLCVKTVFHKPYRAWVHKSQSRKKLFMCAVVCLVLVIIITTQWCFSLVIMFHELVCCYLLVLTNM